MTGASARSLGASATARAYIRAVPTESPAAACALAASRTSETDGAEVAASSVSKCTSESSGCRSRTRDRASESRYGTYVGSSTTQNAASLLGGSYAVPSDVEHRDEERVFRHQRNEPMQLGFGLSRVIRPGERSRQSEMRVQARAVGGDQDSIIGRGAVILLQCEQRGRVLGAHRGIWRDRRAVRGSARTRRPGASCAPADRASSRSTSGSPGCFASHASSAAIASLMRLSFPAR